MRHLIIAGMILLTSSNLMGQVDKMKKISDEVFSMQRRIYVSPLNPLAGNYQMAYEKILSNGNSIVAMAEFISSNAKREYISGYGIGLAYRFTLEQKEGISTKTKYHRLTTVYISPFARFRRLDVDATNYDLSNGESTIAVESYSGGFLLGVNILWSSRFTMDMFVGLGYQGSQSFGSLRFINFPGQPGYSGIIPEAGFRLGWAFR